MPYPGYRTRRVTIPKVREGRIGNSYSLIQTDDGNVSASSPEQTLLITGAGNITVSGIEGNPDIIYVDGDTDHGNLTGLTDDDHTQYTLRNQWLQNGFTNRDDVSISFDEGTRTFTIEPTGDSFDYFIDGVLYTVTSTQTIVIPNSEGIHTIYFDGTTLTQQYLATLAQIRDIILNHSIVAHVYWDVTNSKALMADAVHGYRMSPATHALLFDAFGPQYQTGMTLNDFAEDEDGSLDAHAQFSISAGEFYNQDIFHEMDAIASTVGTVVAYVDGFTFKWQDANGFSVISYSGGSGRLAYNNAGTQTEVSNNSFVLCHIFAVNLIPLTGGNPYYMAFQGQAEYGNISAAREGAQTEINTIAALRGTKVPSILPIATVIFQTSNSYTNSVKARIRTNDTGGTWIDWRTTPLSPGGDITDHGSLSGLTHDDHLQYLLASDATDRTTFATNWTDLTDTGATTLHKHAHGNLDDVGTYTHASIDSHIQDGAIHFAEGSIDHGSILGLNDDDHTQYLLLAGRSGGQTIIGGTGNYQSLTLQSTSSFFKGSILFGASAYLESSNRLGLGTTSPDGRLHVHTNSAGTVTANSVADDLVVENSDNGGISILTPNNKIGNVSFGDPDNNIVGRVTYDHSTDKLSLVTNNADRFTIDSNGKVGIGETSPSYNLHIKSTGDASIFLEADTDDTSETDNPFIKFSQDNTSNQAILGLCGNLGSDPEGNGFANVLADALLFGTTTSGNMQFGVDSVAYMTIDNAGYIGIGTNTPDSELHVYKGNSNATAYTNTILTVESSTTGYISFLTPSGIEKGFLFGDTDDNRNGGILFDTSGNPDGLSFRVGGNLSAIEIDSSKNVTVSSGNLYVDSGSAGIGTSSPDNKLHVHKGSAGTVTANSYSALVIENSTHCLSTILSPGGVDVEQGYIFGDSDDNFTGGMYYFHKSDNADQMSFYTANAQVMTFNSSAQVGIGTATPSYPLQVEYDPGTSNTVDLLCLDSANQGVGSGGYIRFQNDYVEARIGMINSATNDSDLVFETTTDGSTLVEQMRIRHNGKIGIGEDTPLGQVHIKISDAGSISPNTAANGIVLESTSDNGLTIYSGASSDGWIVFADVNNDFTPGGFNYDHNVDALHTYVNNDIAMSINSSRNIGVGISSPDTKLHLFDSDASGTAAASSLLTLEKTSTCYMQFLSDGNQGILFGDSASSTVGRLIYSHSTNNMAFYTNSSAKMTLTSDGNLGIGTTTPSEKLDVNGDAIRVRTSQTPASAGATGTAGMICWDSNYVYVCVATNTWKRAALSTW